MGKNEVFRTKMFGGYQKEEVMDYVRSLENEKETVKILSNKENVTIKAALEKQKEENDKLKNAFLEEKNKILRLEEELKVLREAGPSQPSGREAAGEKEIEELKQQYERKLEGLTDNLNREKERQEALSKALERAEAGKKELEEKIMRQREEAERLKDEFTEFRKESSGKHEEAAAKETLQQKEILKALEAAGQENRSLREMLGSLRRECVEWKQKAEELHGGQEALQEQLEALRNENSEMRECLKNKEEEERTSPPGEMADALQRENAELNLLAENLRGELENLRKNNAELGNACQYLQEENLHLKERGGEEDLERISRQLETLGEEIVRLKKENVRLIEDRKHIKTESLRLFEEQRRYIEEETHKLQAEAEAVQDENSRLRQERMEAQDLYRYLQDENGYLREVNQRLQEDAAILRTALRKQREDMVTGRYERLPGLIQDGWSYSTYTPYGGRDRKNQERRHPSYRQEHRDEYFDDYIDEDNNTVPEKNTEEAVKDAEPFQSDILERQHQKVFNNAQVDLGELLEQLQERIHQLFE